MIVQMNSMGLFGINSYAVSVETDITRDAACFDIVGLPDVVVRESRERVRSAIGNCGFEFPRQRIVVNLAPANIKKIGSCYDLPILLSILIAIGALDKCPPDTAFIGELSLSGEVRPINGILPMTIQAKANGIKQFFVPADNAFEGAVVDGIDLIPVAHVIDLVQHLRGRKALAPIPHTIPTPQDLIYPIDMADVKGQALVKRALEIAACGGHNLLMIGSPGTGKSMLAKRLPTILPDMTFEEMIDTTKIYSVAGMLEKDMPLMTHRPFRAPHHTVSPAGLSGGGSTPRPGEISLAHHGVLFLDELPEFNRNAMEILRQPIEDGSVTISRASTTLTYPCSIMLVAAMNPCPCGYFGHPTRPCTCNKQAVAKYLSRISGPLLDRIDLHIEVPPVEYEALSSAEPEESSAAIKQRVNAVRRIQQERFQGTGILDNAHITPGAVAQFCPMDNGAQRILQSSFDRLGLSARGYNRLLKVARTIADMAHSELIQTAHIMEAVQYRTLDRKYWK